MKKPLIVLTGPTAVGKTELSIRLAKLVGGEIISADSMQVYKHMDIGSAKIMPDEMEVLGIHDSGLARYHQNLHIALYNSVKGAFQGSVYMALHKALDSHRAAVALRREIDMVQLKAGLFDDGVSQDKDLREHGHDQHNRNQRTPA